MGKKIALDFLLPKKGDVYHLEISLKFLLLDLSSSFLFLVIVVFSYPILSFLFLFSLSSFLVLLCSISLHSLSFSFSFAFSEIENEKQSFSSLSFSSLSLFRTKHSRVSYSLVISCGVFDEKLSDQWSDSRCRTHHRIQNPNTKHDVIISQ